MACYNTTSCHYDFNIKTYGLCDLNKIMIDGSNRTALNWNEISVPEILSIPIQKPDIENIDQVYVDTDVSSIKLIETPLSYYSYDILASDADIATLETILNSITDTIITPAGGLAALITVLTGLIGAIANPLVAALNQAVTALNNAITALTNTIAQAETDLAADNLTVSALCGIITLVRNALTLVQTLITALNVILADILADPVLGVIAGVTDAVDNIVALLNTLLGAITTVLTNLLGFNTLCTTATTVIVIRPNAEGTCLSGRKLIVEGSLNQKVVYTADVDAQSVHSADFTIPFSAFIIPYAKFENGVYTENVSALVNGVATDVNGFVFGPDLELIPDLCEEFCIDVCIEDIFAYALDPRTVFKNITLFLYARTSNQCS